MMRVSTSQFYTRSTAQMGALSVAADKLQGQIATGKRIEVPSDDAAGYQRLAGLKQAAADDVGVKANVALAQGVLAQADTTLKSIEEQLQRANELTLQAANGTLTAENRRAIGISIDGIIEDVLSLANAKDTRGQSIFGGGGAAAYARGTGGAIVYVGGAGGAAIPIGDGEVQVTEAGDRAFGEMFAGLSAIAAALREGEAPAGGTEAVTAALDSVSAARGSVGARGFRLDMEMARLADVAIDRKAERSGIEDVDTAAAITELQKTLTILSATQASFGKLSGMSLFDYLR